MHPKPQDIVLPFRLNKLKMRQAKTAEYAASGKLPEYKKWADPAIIEKHWRAHEAVSVSDRCIPGHVNVQGLLLHTTLR